MTLNPTNSSIEVEAKFIGGHAEFERILGWMSGQGFDCVRKGAVHRFHVYFDGGSRLNEIGCRLRCIIAPGEWCRYDFKADSGSGATLEVSLKQDVPVPIPKIIDELSERVPEGEARHRLASVRDTARIILALVGTHEKAIIRGSHVELEVSWDVLSSMETAATISEVEVELVRGKRVEFEGYIAQMSSDSKLERIYGSKLECFLISGRNGKIIESPCV